MLNHYFDWVIQKAYNTDKKLHFGDEPTIGQYRTTPGATLAILLVGWPFILIAILGFVLPLSVTGKFIVWATDAFIMLVSSVILAIKISRKQKADAAAWLATEEQELKNN